MADSRMTNDDQNIVDFELKGIGPFSDILRFKFQNKRDIKLAIYATNGTGKTFISRCFNELTAQKLSEDTYYPKMNLMSFGKEKGEFKVNVTIKDDANNKTESSFKITRNNTNKDIKPNLDDIIYYVFNSDYIKKQFISRDYIPNAEIEGEIIVGEENIKTDKLSKEIDIKKTKNEKIREDINKKINTEKNNLKNNYNISEFLSEFKSITFDNIIRGDVSECNKNKKDLIDEYHSLKSFEKNAVTFNDIAKVNCIITEINIESINEELKATYNKTNITNTFFQKIKKNLDFIEHGHEITKNNNCPYCEQSLDGARELITAYDNFFDETQKNVKKKLSNYKQQFEILENSLKTLINTSGKSLKQFNDLKGYFPSTKNAILDPIIFPDDMSNAIIHCKNQIVNKINDISITNIDITNEFNIIGVSGTTL